MAKKVELKHCEMCEKELFNVDIATKYCISCKEISYRNSVKKYKKKTRTVKSKIKEVELINNFNTVVKEMCHLTPIGFNCVSDVSYNSYQNLYKKPWIEILKLFGRYDDLVNYVVSEYKEYVNETGKQGFREFYNNHKYIGGQLLKTIGHDYIRSLAGVTKRRNTKNDCINEFLRLKSKFNRIPLYREFLDNSKISLKSFIFHFHINSEPIYDQIVKYCSTEVEYEEYLKNKSTHKAKMGRENHQGFKYSVEELRKNLEDVFNKYHEEYGSYPSLHLFDKISDIDSSVYTYRFNKKWLEICKDFGFNIERKLFKSEKIALGIISELLNEEYEPQKTFDWLIGFKGFPLFCDGYFPRHKLIVEFDGEQHRYPNDWFGGLEVFHNIRTNDKYKDILIPRNGLRLIRISSEEPFWDKGYIKNKLIKNNILRVDNV